MHQKGDQRGVTPPFEAIDGRIDLFSKSFLWRLIGVPEYAKAAS